MATAAPRYLAWRAGYRTVGRLSEGVRTGLRHGFDSGPFMAYVYDNRPAGTLPLGRMIDRRLLESRTCTAFREIAGLARDALRELLDERAGSPTFVVDLASGPGSYVIDVLAERRRPEVHALLRDVDPKALRVAARTAAERDVEVETAAGDALDPDSLAAVGRPPDVALELGLYGIYPDARIRPHFRDLAERLGPRTLLCNVQSQNPEIDHISNVWPSRDGELCRWRLRPLDLILEWAGEAGFACDRVRRDSQGIYNVVTLRLR
jgi:hypothetical protein